MTIRQISGGAALVAVAAATLGLLAAPLAQADDGGARPAVSGEAAPAAVAPGDLAAARSGVQSPAVLDRVGHFFARDGLPPARTAQLGAADEAAAAAKAAPRLQGATVPVYTLDPGFVAGAKGAPVARAEFAATAVVAADGRTASVWTVAQGGAWRVVDIASGSDETDYATRGAGTGGGTVFREPQVNAWYVLRGGRVLPLDAEARSSVGAGGTTLASYQRLVHQRYGDKLPGSAYDRAGLGGGFSADPPAEAATASGASSASASLPATTATTAAVTAAAALGLTGLAAAGSAFRRRCAKG